MTRFMMEKVKTNRAPQEMGPLNPYARRIVHMTVAEDPALVIREHRRRVSQDRDHLGPAVKRRAARGRADERRPCFQTDDTHRRDCDARRARRHRCRPCQRTGRAAHRDGADRTTSASSHGTRRSCASAARDGDAIRRSSPVFRRPPPTPAKTSSRSARTAAPCCSTRSSCGDGRGRAARGARRVHAARVPAWPDRSGAGRSRADLVDAVTPLQARAALDQLEGTLTERIRAIDAALFDLSARLEASLDFPGEGYHFVDPGRGWLEIARDPRRSTRCSATRVPDGSCAKGRRS